MAGLIKFKNVAEQYRNICNWYFELYEKEDSEYKQNTLNSLSFQQKDQAMYIWRHKESYLSRDRDAFFSFVFEYPNFLTVATIPTAVNFFSKWVDYKGVVELFYINEFWYEKTTGNLGSSDAFDKAFKKFSLNAARTLFNKEKKADLCYFKFFLETLPSLEQEFYSKLRDSVGKELKKLRNKGLIGLDNRQMREIYEEYVSLPEQFKVAERLMNERSVNVKRKK